MPERSTPTLSIGALSRATGIAVETLRTWERRYGFPEPIRLPSGHRRYLPESVDRLRLVRKALELGHRPSTVVGTEVEELERLLRITGGPSVGARESGARDAVAQAVVGEWLERVGAFDGRGLGQSLLQCWNRRGARGFVLDVAVPALQEVGRRWRSGQLTISHEHFASEQLRDFLAAQWRPLDSVARGPRVVLATLPDEHHGLALHLAAALLTTSDVRVTLLGPDSPVDEIARTVATEDAAGLVVAVSAAADPETTREAVGQLRRSVSGDVAFVVGGPNPTHDFPGVTFMGDFGQLEPWARTLLDGERGRNAEA